VLGDRASGGGIKRIDQKGGKKEAPFLLDRREGAEGGTGFLEASSATKES